MRLTPRIEEAIRIAAFQHKNQERKGEDGMPYVVHPFIVALTAATYTDDEDTIVAALLHDVIEDTAYTKEQLLASFGGNVSAIVLAVSEKKELPRKERKEAYIKNIAGTDSRIKIVAACDKIHNMRSMISGLQKHGDKMWGIIGISKEEYLSFFDAVYNVIAEDMPHALEKEYSKTYQEFKKTMK